MMDKVNQNLIALLTDFGTKDYFVGAMKGAILSIAPNAQIVDITHEIAPQNIRSASFTLRACSKNFPAKTIFVAVVDPGVGSERRAILVETGDYFFVAPDNGLLGFVFNEAEEFRVFELTNRRFFARQVSATFHGRDIFAPVAAHLSKGVKADEFGAAITDFVRFKETKPRKISVSEIEAEIIEIDRFGNLITNLKREALPESFALEIGGERIEKLRNYFAEAEKSEIFMITGSAEFLEIVAFQASAKNILKAEIGQKITVKIQ
ncbi:MAG TPA: SAM-dependent chlorinase/fluorinase [Pyrinomonadaceae bacterium]|nr:SAM-dependent chlorinase/fluorinase [Pyrinomonadaceae bacterium]